MKWCFQQEDGDIFVLINGHRAVSEEGILQKIKSVDHGSDRNELWFKFENSKAGRRLKRQNFDGINPFSSKIKDSMAESNLAVIQQLSEYGITRTKAKASQTKPKERPHWENTAIAELSTPPDELKNLKAKSAGYKRLSVQTIEVARPEFQIRPINEIWVQQIKQNLIRCPGSAITRIPVLLDPATIDNIENYKSEILSEVNIFALGGNHLLKAIKSVCMEEPENECYECLRKIDVEVFVGLTVDEALFIANWHNKRCETMMMTFQDKVKVARQQFLTGEKDWKHNFVKIIGDLECKETTVAAMSTVLSVASYQPDDYKLVDSLFENYVQTECPGKSFPQNLFKSLQGVPNKTVYLMRAQGTNGLKQSKIILNDKKKQSMMKIFLSETKCGSWEMATSVFPEACNQLMEIAVATTSKSSVPVEAVNIIKKCRETGDDINDIVVDISIKVNQRQFQNENIKNLVKKYKKLIKLDVLKTINKNSVNNVTDEE